MAEDDKTRLTPLQKNRLAERLRDLWPDDRHACPVCGDTNWIIADHLVTPNVIGPNNSLMLGGTSYPQIMVISKTCGYTMYLNALTLGFSHDEVKSEAEAKQELPDGSS